MGKFVTVAVYGNEIEARLAQATLAAANIESFLKTEDVSGLFPMFHNSKGVKVLVDEAKIEEARIILSTPAREENDR